MSIKKILPALFGAVLCLAQPAHATDWKDLHTWQGSYPVKLDQGKRSDILQDKRIAPILRRLLSPKEQIALKQYTTSAPIALIDGHFLVIENCKPHDCPSEFAMVVLDTENTKLWVGLFLREEAQVMTHWVGSADDYTRLPGAILNAFREKHGD
jgi:hypothetical protein